MKFTILPLISVQFCDINYIHMVVQPSPLSISRTFSSSSTQTLYPLHSNFPFSLPPTIFFKSGKKELQTTFLSISSTTGQALSVSLSSPCSAVACVLVLLWPLSCLIKPPGDFVDVISLLGHSTSLCLVDSVSGSFRSPGRGTSNMFTWP